MEKIVDMYVKTYQSDFEQDKRVFEKNSEEDFIWVVKPTDTHLASVSETLCQGTGLQMKLPVISKI